MSVQADRGVEPVPDGHSTPFLKPSQLKLALDLSPRASPRSPFAARTADLGLLSDSDLDAFHLTDGLEDPMKVIFVWCRTTPVRR